MQRKIIIHKNIFIRIFSVQKLGKSFSKKSHVIHEFIKLAKLYNFVLSAQPKFGQAKVCGSFCQLPGRGFGGRRWLHKKKTRKDDCVRQFFIFSLYILKYQQNTLKYIICVIVALWRSKKQMLERRSFSPWNSLQRVLKT